MVRDTYTQARDNENKGGRRAPKEESKEEALRKMFVGGLPRDTTDDNLQEYFSQFGELVDHIVIKDQGGFSKGFGFVTFATDDQADACIKHKAEGHMVNGKSVEVKRAIPRDADPDQREKNTKIFLGGLSRDTDEETVKNYFENKFNCTVDSVDLIYEKKDQVAPGQEPKRRGFGFVTINCFDTVDHLCVIKTHEIDGKMVEVKKAAPKPDNRRGGSGGGGGGRGGYNNSRSSYNNQGSGYNQGGSGGYNQGGNYGGNYGGGYNQGGYDQGSGYGGSYGGSQGGYNQSSYGGGYNQGGYGGGYQNNSFSGPDKGGRGGKQGGRGGYKPY